MLRCLVDRLHRADFDDLAKVHDHHPVADVANHAEVVRDEEIGQRQPRPEVGQKVQHLRLDRLVQRRHGFIEDQHPRPHRERARDIRALPLPAGKFVRIALRETLGRQAHQVQRLMRARLRLGPAAALRFRPEGDRILDRKPRVQRGVAVLENHLHLFAQIADAGSARGPDLAAIQRDAALVRRDQIHDQPCRGGLAAARLADDAQRFARADREGQVVDGPDHRSRSALQSEMFLQSRDRQQRARGDRVVGSGAGHIFTSVALRSPSLRKLKHIDVRKIIRPGRIAIIGAA